MAAYCREIDRTPLLTAEEEKELAYRIQEGDSQARDHLVRANLRLVVNVSRSYAGRGLDLQDLIAEGNLGLMRAVEAFDPTMNTRFSTYAIFWIKQSLKRALINQAKTIRLPAYTFDLLAKWRRASAVLHEHLGRPPAPEEVAARMHLSKKKLKIVQKALRIYNAVPEVDRGQDLPSIDEVLTDGRASSPDLQLAQRDALDQVLELLDQLEPREQKVLRLRYGLSGEEPMTLKDIGTRLGLTRERVRQIEVLALRKLNESLQESGAGDEGPGTSARRSSSPLAPSPSPLLI
jgi:RNA polymerase primary sigma factor